MRAAEHGALALRARSVIHDTLAAGVLAC